MRALSSTARRPLMLGAEQQRRHRPDYVLVLISVVLLALGLIVVYAISPGLSAQKGVGENYYVSKQGIAILLGILAFAITAQAPLSIWKNLEKAFIFIAGGAAVAVQLFGEEVNGAARWIHIGGLSFQAVELIKFALLIWLSGFLTQRIRAGELADTIKTFKPILIAVALVSLVVVVFQSDLGSGGVIIAMVGTMCFVAGIPMRRVLLFAGLIAIFGALAISTSSYRRQRFFTFLNPESDCQNSGYQAAFEPA